MCSNTSANVIVQERSFNTNCLCKASTRYNQSRISTITSSTKATTQLTLPRAPWINSDEMGPQTPSHLQRQITHMVLVSCLTVAQLPMLAGTYVLSIGSHENLLPFYVTTGQRFGLWFYNQATNPLLDQHCMTAVFSMHLALRHSHIVHTKAPHG